MFLRVSRTSEQVIRYRLCRSFYKTFTIATRAWRTSHASVRSRFSVCFSFAVSAIGSDLRGLPRGRALAALRLRLTSFSRCVNDRTKNVECDRCLRCILSPLGMFQSIKFLFLFDERVCFYQSILCPKIERRKNNLDKKNFQKL